MLRGRASLLPPPPMDHLRPLHALSDALGVLTAYTDGLGRQVAVPAETLVRVCAALGAEVSSPADAEAALRAREASAAARRLPPVVVAWDGILTASLLTEGHPARALDATLRLEDGTVLNPDAGSEGLRFPAPLPAGYHTLTLDRGAGPESCAIIAAPQRAYRGEATPRRWGVAAHLAALRSSRSRSLGDLGDLTTLARWVGSAGGDVVSVLPLLPTFNTPPAEPSPYAPVSRLFWSELLLDLGEGHMPTAPPPRLDVTRADAEARAALAGRTPPPEVLADDELLRYARFRGAQVRLGRNWRSWPEPARSGTLRPDDVDPDEERFHLVAQALARRQLDSTGRALAAAGVRLGLDLAVGVHPDGYDTWSRQALFAPGMSVGAPPDPGFPSGQDWGFPPVLPEASRAEGHRYLAASIAHQAAVAGTLRIDHVMALSRLYWIPSGAGLDEGTYVRYPLEELMAVTTLESHRHRCEIVGENLGTVPGEIHEALPRHAIDGIHLFHFAVGDEGLRPPGEHEVALVGTHDTPTLAGWVEGRDIDERVRCGLLAEARAPEEHEERTRTVGRLAGGLGVAPDDLPGLLERLLAELGASPTPRVMVWLEDLWLERDQVNLPGTPSSQRPNWQRPMTRLLDEALSDPIVGARVACLQEARHPTGGAPDAGPAASPDEAQGN